MRIVAGAWRGRVLAAPGGPATRPTADRVRQALFDSLMHAPWALGADGRPLLLGATVLDAFAGSGALGLEALSRGAAQATFMEREPAALAALRTNVARCGAEARVLAADATAPPSAEAGWAVVFLDPPYRQGLIARALPALAGRGWIAPGALLVMESAADEPVPVWDGQALLVRVHGAARITGVRWRDQPGDRPALLDAGRVQQ